jgi:predicted NodU family carbamoyl transferase
MATRLRCNAEMEIYGDMRNEKQQKVCGLAPYGKRTRPQRNVSYPVCVTV